MRWGLSRALARRAGSSRGAVGAVRPDVRHIQTDARAGSTGPIGPSSEPQGLEALVGGMRNHARGFPIKGEGVEILESPSQFYNALLEGVRSARSRVVIASLYIGTGSLEQALLQVIADSLARKPSLQVTILCDALRATRPSRESDLLYPSSAAMLSDILLSERALWRKSTVGDRPKEPVRVALYHTPMLNRVLKTTLPARVQEIVGVCHLKAFVFDDDVILTGANVSGSYFTVRQDRYLCFPGCRNLASHFCSLINTVAFYSYALTDMGRVQRRSAHLDPVTESEAFCTEFSDAVYDLTKPVMMGVETVEGADTWVFPTVQAGPFGIRQDEAAFLWLLKQLPSNSNLHLSSPYFNLTPEYEDAMLEAARDKYVHILTASPKANGFYGSSGISGFIPLAYSLLEQQLHNRAVSIYNDDEESSFCSRKYGLSIYEYESPGWTFHAKGLWCRIPGSENGPSVSLIGSSNLGYRSRDRDLEAQVFLFTNAPHLQQHLERERADLFACASRVNSSIFRGPDRRGGFFASLALKLIKPWL